MRTLLRVVLATLVVGMTAACASTPSVGPQPPVLTGGMLNVDSPGYDVSGTKFHKGELQTAATVDPKAFNAPACTLGERVGYNRDTIFIIDYTVLKETNLVTTILNAKKTLSLAAPVLQHSKAERMDGQGFIVVHMNLDPSLFPSRQIPFLTGDHICAGTALIEPEGEGFSRVTIPIRGGTGLAQAAIVLPRGPLLALRNQFTPCSQAVGFRTTLNVEVKGRFAGMPDTKCPTGVPEAPTLSHTAYQLIYSYEGELYVFIEARSPASAGITFQGGG